MDNNNITTSISVRVGIGFIFYCLSSETTFLVFLVASISIVSNVLLQQLLLRLEDMIPFLTDWQMKTLLIIIPMAVLFRTLVVQRLSRCCCSPGNMCHWQKNFQIAEETHAKKNPQNRRRRLCAGIHLTCQPPLIMVMRTSRNHSSIITLLFIILFYFLCLRGIIIM